MSRLVRKWKFEKEVFEVPADFNEQQSAEIIDVAVGSPAEEIGLAKGDRFIGLNGEPLQDQIFLDFTLGTTAYKYQFYLRSSHKIINVETDPVPLGFLIEPSSERIIKDLRGGGFPGWEGFHTLWKRRDWETLLKAADTTYSNTGVSRLMRKVSKTFGFNAGMLYTGAALFEMGKEEEGIEIIIDFMNSVMYDYETSEHAIAYFYLAKWSELVGNKEELEKCLKEADRSNGGTFERISHELYLKNIQPCPGKYKWLDKVFPSHYCLNKLGTEEKISLSKTLSGMKEEQLLPICVMPYYRDNGPYNEAMGCYGSIYEYISDRLLPFHIILDTLESVAGQEWRRENENNLIENGIPFELIHDPERSVTDALEIEFSPEFFVVNKAGIVVYNGSLKSGFHYWTALNAGNRAIEPARLQA